MPRSRSDEDEENETGVPKEDGCRKIVVGPGFCGLRTMGTEVGLSEHGFLMSLICDERVGN